MRQTSDPDPWTAYTTAELIRAECETIAGAAIERRDTSLDGMLAVYITDGQTRMILLRHEDNNA